MTRYLALLLLLIGGLLPTHARADCKYLTSDGNMGVLYFQPAASVTVNTSVPVGTILQTWNVPQGIASNVVAMNPYFGSFHGNGAMGVGWACTTTNASMAVQGIGANTIVNGHSTYATNVPGIGVQIQYVVNGVYLPMNYPTADYLTVIPPVPTGYTYGNWLTSGSTVNLFLVKTGPISGGTLSGDFAGWFANNNGGQQVVRFTWGGGGIVIIPNTPSCQVTTPSKSLSVTLPDVPATDFGGVGTTAGAPQNFSINLNCSGGDAGTSTNVYVTLTDATNPANATDMLSPTSATAGTGVGVRIYRGSTPVKYGPDSNTVGNTNQWQVSTVGPGSSTVNIPLTATYVQVGSTVHGGAVSAIATFTMAYN